MNHEFTQPNLHVALIHFPIGLFIVGVAIETFCMLFARRSSARIAGRWMILLGTIFCVPTVFSGLYAMRDVMQTGDLVGGSWNETLAQSPIANNPAAWEAMTDHLWLSVGATLAAMVLVCGWIAMSNAWRRLLGPVVLVGLIASSGAMLASAHHGGELVHVFRVTTQGDMKPGESQRVEPSTQPSTFHDTLLAVAPPLQSHVIVGGLTFAIAWLSLALSIRAVCESSAVAPSDLERIDPPIQIKRTPVARYWWLAAVLAFSAIASGWWYLANESGQWTFAGLLNLVRTERELSSQFLTRRVVHIASGSLLLILSIVLGLLTRFAPRSRFVITLLGLLVFVALVVQVWVGVVMLLDSSAGPVTVFAES